MEEQLFNDLLQSIKEAGAHMRGEFDLPPENTHFVSEPDPREVEQIWDCRAATSPIFSASAKGRLKIGSKADALPRVRPCNYSRSPQSIRIRYLR